jgi:hypothetical protein
MPAGMSRTAPTELPAPVTMTAATGRAGPSSNAAVAPAAAASALIEPWYDMLGSRAAVTTPSSAGHSRAPTAKATAPTRRRKSKYQARMMVAVRAARAHRNGSGRYGFPMSSSPYPGRIATSADQSPTAAAGATTSGMSAAAEPISSRGTVASPRRRASSAAAASATTARPASGQTNQFG